ncbi:type III secretion system protein [Pseudomonas typographi]|uniref:type III secretion system protein n=1 Tax=Pseudomonas typographi TaxID=2715964 RepID=UPI001682CFD7|nr:type III secretion system protein [Pseudomonas typographi]MBD1554527.1 type III secretion system protein [Pseudomonas typographi]MBD1589575.1 type III secretion system protein [Pseudomonas typographi]
MTALALRQVPAAVASATRALGAGARLAFSAQGMAGTLSLEALPAGHGAATGLWLNSAVGALRLSDAGAVLSLLGEQPVVVEGEPQSWYWPFISQYLSTAVAHSLAPIEPLASAAPEGPLIECRLRVQRGEEQVHAYMGATPGTLLRWLSAPGWQRQHNALANTFAVPFPLVLGRATLTAEQLASLRPGDVLLPPQCLFDTEGHGQVELADQRWAARAHHHEHRLLLTLSHEENDHHEHP